MFWTIIFGFHYYENEPLWFRCNAGNAKKASRHFQEIPLCQTAWQETFAWFATGNDILQNVFSHVHHFVASFFQEKRTVWCKRDFLLQSYCHMSEDDVPSKIESLIIMVLLYLNCHRRAIDEYFYCLWHGIHIWYLGRDNFIYFVPSKFFALKLNFLFPYYWTLWTI